MALVAFLLALGAGGRYLLFSPAFALTEVKIDGASAATERDLRAIIDTQIQKRRYLFFPQRSLLSFNWDAAHDEMDKAFVFDLLEAQKALPHALNVTVKEKQLKAALAYQGTLYALDSGGMVFRKLSDREAGSINNLPTGFEAVSVPSLEAEKLDVAEDSGTANNPFPLVIDAEKGSEEELQPGNTIFSDSIMSMVLEAHARLGDLMGIQPLWFEVDERGESIKVNMEGGVAVFLHTAQSFGVQAERLSLVLKEKIADRVKDLEYVDLRHNEKIYFKYKGEGGT